MTAASLAAARLLLHSGGGSSSSTAAMAISGAFAVAGGGYALVDSKNNHNRPSSNHFSHAATAARTTRCEAAASTATTKPLPGVNLRSRMTAIGHFSILSETVHNPSICTFVMTLSGNNGVGFFSARDFCSLWKEREMATRHPRFHLRASATHPGHFESTSTSSTTSSSTSSLSKNDYYIDNNDSDDVDPVELHVSEGLPLQIPRRNDILQRIRQMQTQPWSLQEKLWHVSVIPCNNDAAAAPLLWGGRQAGTTTATTSSSSFEKQVESSSSILLFRGHHVLADGASMGAALMDLSDEAQEFRDQIKAFVHQRRRMQAKKFATFWQRLLQRFKLYLWLCTGSMQALLYQTKLVLYNMFWNDADPWSIVKKAAHDEQSKKTRTGSINGSGIMDPTTATTSGNNTMDNNETTTATAADLRSVSYTTMAPLVQAKWVAETLSKKYNENDDNNSKKRKKSNITINDLFVTAITAAVMRQLKEHRQRLDVISSYQHQQDDDEKKKKEKSSSIPQQDRIHVSVPVHLKGGVVLPGESVGNNIGAFTVQLPGEAAAATTSTTTETAALTAPVQRLFAVHEELNKVKQTPVPLLSNMLARMSVACLPSTWVSYLFQKANAGSTCVITNVRGPSSQPMHIMGRTVESIYGFVPLPPGIPIGVVVSSYADQMLLTVTAESWAVPNADLFLSWVVDEYLVLLQEASRAAAAAASKEQ